MLDDVLGPSAAIAIPDCTRTPNCGDSAISLGLFEYLHRRPHRVAFVAEWHTPKWSVSRALPSDGILLFLGGNGLGDVWPEDQRLREEWIAAFPRHRVVLAPQSIHFKDPARLDRARLVLDSHPDVTVLCRDSASYDLAKANFDVRVELCPDAAFLLRPLVRPIDPTLDLLWLARSDYEAAPESSPDSITLPAGVEPSDWIEDVPVGGYRQRHATAANLTAQYLPYAVPAWLNPALRELFVHLTRSRVLRSVNYLSRARVVITDRLHGHIFCTMLGIRHVVLPSLDNKTANFIATWTKSTGLVSTAENAGEALEIGKQLLREGR